MHGIPKIVLEPVDIKALFHLDVAKWSPWLGALLLT
jgi:preprotein translocase subunit SecB